MSRLTISRADYAPGPGTGVFSIGEAGAILDINKRTARRWVDGYTYKTLAGDVQTKGAVVSTRATSSFISFAELIELNIVKRLINEGVQLKNVVHFAHAMAENLGELPLAQIKRFTTFGKDIYAQNEGVYVSVDQFQHTFDFVREFSKMVEVDSNQISDKWFPIEGTKIVVLDASREFGHPIIDSKRVRVSSVIELYRATGSKEAVFDLYEITEDEFEAAHEAGNRFFPVA